MTDTPLDIAEARRIIAAVPELHVVQFGHLDFGIWSSGTNGEPENNVADLHVWGKHSLRPREFADSLIAARTALPAALDEIERLRAAVLKFGMHTNECANSVFSLMPMPCNCGWDELKATLQSPREEPSNDYA